MNVALPASAAVERL